MHTSSSLEDFARVRETSGKHCEKQPFTGNGQFIKCRWEIGGGQDSDLEEVSEEGLDEVEEGSSAKFSCNSSSSSFYMEDKVPVRRSESMVERPCHTSSPARPNTLCFAGKSLSDVFPNQPSGRRSFCGSFLGSRNLCHALSRSISLEKNIRIEKLLAFDTTKKVKIWSINIMYILSMKPQGSVLGTLLFVPFLNVIQPLSECSLTSTWFYKEILVQLQPSSEPSDIWSISVAPIEGAGGPLPHKIPPNFFKNWFHWFNVQYMYMHIKL